VRYRDVLSGSVSDVLELVVPPPEAALQIARRRIAAGEQPAGHAEVHPVYGRDADAVANFAVRGDAP
jgi:hypothetical protein